MKGEFVCMNEIFLIFQFLLPLGPKFLFWVCDSLKENSIFHRFFFFFYFENEFFIRKILIYVRWICVHELNFPHVSVSSGVLTQLLHMNLSHFERELNSASSRFFFLLRWRIFDKKNFNFRKGEFVCKNEIFLIF